MHGDMRYLCYYQKPGRGKAKAEIPFDEIERVRKIVVRGLGARRPQRTASAGAAPTPPNRAQNTAPSSLGSRSAQHGDRWTPKQVSKYTSLVFVVECRRREFYLVTGTINALREWLEHLPSVRAPEGEGRPLAPFHAALLARRRSPPPARCRTPRWSGGGASTSSGWSSSRRRRGSWSRSTCVRRPGLLSLSLSPYLLHQDTIQGESGWYKDHDGSVFFFDVTPDGEWLVNEQRTARGLPRDASMYAAAQSYRFAEGDEEDGSEGESSEPAVAEPAGFDSRRRAVGRDYTEDRDGATVVIHTAGGKREAPAERYRGRMDSEEERGDGEEEEPLQRVAGTRAGSPGWYMDARSGEAYYYDVTADGGWVLDEDRTQRGPPAPERAVRVARGALGSADSDPTEPTSPVDGHGLDSASEEAGVHTTLDTQGQSEGEEGAKGDGGVKRRSHRHRHHHHGRGRGHGREGGDEDRHRAKRGEGGRRSRSGAERKGGRIAFAEEEEGEEEELEGRGSGALAVETGGRRSLLA